MKTIWKYELTGPDTRLTVPWYARVISCGVQDDTPFVWIMLDKDQPKVKDITVRLVGTGHEFDFPIGETTNRFVGTLQIVRMVGTLVFHVFTDDNKDGV